MFYCVVWIIWTSTRIILQPQLLPTGESLQELSLRGSTRYYIKNGMMWTFDVLSTKGNTPDSKGIAWSRGSLFKTLLDRDQYVTGLKNSSHWPDIYFGMASAASWIQSAGVRPRDRSTFHIFTSHLHHAIFLNNCYYSKSNYWASPLPMRSSDVLRELRPKHNMCSCGIYPSQSKKKHNFFPFYSLAC